MFARFSKVLPALAVLAGIGVLGTPPPAHGAFKLLLQQTGFADVEVTDGNADGVITFAGSFGTFVVNVTTGLSKPALPSPANPSLAQLHLDTVTVESGSGGLLTITLTDTDYDILPVDLPGQNAAMKSSFAGTLTASNDSSATFQAYASLNNLEYDVGPDPMAVFTTGPQGPFGPPAFNNTATTTFGLDPDGVFSLTAVLVIDLKSGGVYSSNGDVTVTTPEPASLAMALIAVPLAGGVHLLRRRKTAA
jgi:hypothetical protein